MVKPCSFVRPFGVLSAVFQSGEFSLRAVLLFLFVLLISARSVAVVETYEFDSDAMRERYQTFIEELRCPKCQNQNLSGSDSAIATDLRRELYRLLEEGRSDDEVVDFMVSRYGQYILYKPKVNESTYLLWFGPAGMLLIGFGVLVLILRRRGRQSGGADTVGVETLNEQEQARLKALLQQSDDSAGKS